MNFSVGQKLTIEFGTSEKPCKVIALKADRVVVSVDLGGRHPLLTSMSYEQLRKAVVE